MKKRLLKLSSLFLSLAMVLSLFCTASLTSNAETNVIYVDATINEDDASTNTYKTLATAVSNATAGTSSAMGTTIMFKSDYTTTSSVSVNKKYITIDLNKHIFTAEGTNAKGIAVSTTGVVIQNGTMRLDASNANNTQYNCIFIDNQNNSKKTTIKNIAFEFVAMPTKSGDLDTNPGALIRNYSTVSNTTNVYNCSFKCNNSVTANASLASLVACSTTSMNFYSCSFDGNGIFSGIQVRANDSNQRGRVGIYNCNFSNVNYLFSKSSGKQSTTDTSIKSQATIYGATVNNAAALCAEPDNVTITAAEHAKMPDLDALTAPYTFDVVCAHSFVDGVCKYCYAPKPTAPTAPAIKMDTGAAMRIDGKTEGIRFSATVDKDALDGFGYEIIDTGMLVAKKEQASADTLTVDNSETVTSSGESIGIGKVVAARYNGITFKDVPEANKYVIYCSLVEISEKNANQKYVARAFIEYKDGEGKTAYIYSDLSDARSIAEVAKLIKDDNKIQPDTGKTYYDSLCSDHKAVVDNWASRLSVN